MANKQEVTNLRKALEKERCAVRSAQDEVAALLAALDSERSAVRALRRDIVNQIKKVKEEEAEKYAVLVEQLKEKSSLEQEEALRNQKEDIRRLVTAEFQRLQQSREAELQRESSRKEEDLRHQLRDALNRLNELTNKTNTITPPTSSATYSNTNSSTAATSVTNNSNNNEFLACRAQNKQLELRIQELLEAERRNADKVRTQHEEHTTKEAELQKTSRREIHIMLEKLKSKDRTIEQLEKEMRKLRGRLEASSRNPPDLEKPGEPPRNGIKKRLVLKSNGLSGETARARCDPIKETNSNDLTDQQSCCDNSNSTTTQETDTQDKGPSEDNVSKTNGKETKIDDEKDENESNNENIEQTASLPAPENDIAINSWTKAVGLETLYQVVVAEHQELQRSYQALSAKLRAEQKARADLEASIQQNRSENPINLALAAQIQELTVRQAELISENHDLREQNDLLEFRLLEIDSAPSSLLFKTPSSPSRSPESRGDREVDDISDSGVLSLPTSEDISETDFHELAMEPCNNRDIKSKLSHLCQTVDNVSDRISIQQGLALLRHYEARLEAALVTMSPDTNKNGNMPEMLTLTSDSAKSQSRIIATVLPFTDLSQTNGKQKDEVPTKKLLKDADCLQESGIFEESSDSPEYCTRWTQTDWSPEKLEATPGDLSLEIRKLKQIRERIEEQGGNKRLLRLPGEEDQCQNAEIKELLFYRDRVELLENKLAIYESSGDEQIRRLNTRLEKEILLSAQLKHLKERCSYLEELNRRLEEEKCEFEEAENDTRLRCQKLEVKLSALGEKKSDLQVQLQQNARSLANLKSCLAEEEKKRIEARQHASQMEALVQCYEQRNFELEEKEMEARWKCQMLEGTIPALITYNTWKASQNMSNKNNKGCNKNVIKQTKRMLPPCPRYPQQTPSIMPPRSCCNSSKTGIQKSASNLEAEDIYCSLKSLENDLSVDYNRFEQSKTMEKCLREKVHNLEYSLNQIIKENEGSLPRKQKEELYIQLKCLNKEKHDLESKVKDLELKECYYKQTLQQADGMWASMEHDYKDQIRQYECKLEEKQKELQDVEELVAKLCVEKENRNCLQERVCCLESEIKDLNFKLCEKEMERKHFEKEEHRLCCELANTTEELNYIKNCVEPCLRKQLDDHKKLVKELKKEIQDLEREREQDIEDRHVEVSCLKRKINSLSKEILENECTISELREEVQTLEIAVSDLREKYFEEQENRERLIIKMTAEIEDKDREISDLLKQKSTKLPKSARQELEEAENFEILNSHKNYNDKRSKSYKKHKAKCHLTLKKLNEKIKAGLLVDENELNSFSSSSSGDDSSCESLNNSLNFTSSSSSNELINIENHVNSSCDNKLSSVIKEKLSCIENETESLIADSYNPSLRLTELKVMKDDPCVDCKSTEVVASSQTSQDISSSISEKFVTEQKVLSTENNTESASSSQRLNSAIKHSTRSTKYTQTDKLDEPSIQLRTEKDNEDKSSKNVKGILVDDFVTSSPVLPVSPTSSQILASNNEYSKPVPHGSLIELLLEHKNSEKKKDSRISFEDEYFSFSDTDVEETPEFVSSTDISAMPDDKEKEVAKGQDDEEINIPKTDEVTESIPEELEERWGHIPEESKDYQSRKKKKAELLNKNKIADKRRIRDSGLLEPTVPSLLMTVQSLLSKLSSKDQLIQCLADELICLADNGCCWKNSLLECIATYPSKRFVDFDCALLVDYLAGFVYYKPYELIEDSQTDHPLDLKIIGATTFDSLLISWKIPRDSEVSGFDIYVNDELVERIRDPVAKRTLLHPVNMQEEVIITVCALDKCGVHLLCDVMCIPPVSKLPNVQSFTVEKPSRTDAPVSFPDEESFVVKNQSSIDVLVS